MTHNLMGCYANVWVRQKLFTKVGEEIAKKALALGITTCVFDRGGFLYAGRVKCLAEGARSGGLQF